MLRKYQHTIKHFLFSEWAQHSSIMIQMPTGTGKTHLLASVIYDHLKEGQYQCVWIVAHRRELVEQIVETVARYGISKEDGRVKVMSIQWLSRHWEDVKDERPSLIVIDEAHHALAETYKELWTRYPNAKKLGMTATPCRLNRKGFTDLFDTLIISDSIADFIRQGWLSAFDYVSIRLGSEDQRLIDCLEKRGADGDFQVKEMDAVLNRRPSIERLYESVRQYADGKKGIVYAVSISHARNIAEYYNNKGVNAVAIDSKTPAKLRKQMVEDFRQGKIQVLVNVDVFSEGFDCPDVEFVQMARLHPFACKISATSRTGTAQDGRQGNLHVDRQRGAVPSVRVTDRLSGLAGHVRGTVGWKRLSNRKRKKCFLYGCRASEGRGFECGRFAGDDCIAQTVDGLPAKQFFPV